MTLDAIIQEVRTLPVEQRKQLVMLIIESLADAQSEKRYSLLELDGLGADLWQGIDAQAYVDEARGEWDKAK